MEYSEPRTQRNKKSTKAKEKYERTGGFSKKHVRIVEALAEKKPTKSQVNKNK
jgi:hypothetical protein